DNSLYYYNKEMKMPKIQKWDNEIENKSPEQTYPGSLGTMLELDYSLLEPDKIEWKYLDDKKMLYLYKKLDSTIIENYIDPTTGFSMLRRESKIDEDKTIVAIEAEVIDISFEPVFESDEFDVEKFSEVLEQ
ncbi:MAG: hypothetical protein N4A40_00930, partial [Tissierellales bacterium]|nr:hypothetical protein [Tissierellales bacterium]